MVNLQVSHDLTQSKPAILFFGNLPPPYGGLPSHFEFMVPKLIAAGYTPVVLVRQTNDYSAWNDIGAFVYHFPDDSEGLNREESDFRDRVSPAELAEVEDIARNLIKISVPERFLGDLGFADRIARAHSVRLIHTYHVFHRSTVALALKTLRRLPGYITIFGEVVSDYGLNESMRPHVRWMLEKFDQILATSVHCASGVELVGMSREQVRVIPYGVDLNFFRKVDPGEVVDRHGLHGRPVILFQGRISGEKGPQVLIDALPHVISQLPQVITLFVGPDEGPGTGPTGLSDVLKPRVAELGLAQHVVFVGSVPFDELPLYYSAADVLAFPSTTPRECMGLALKQAMACQLPVVAARSGGACEAVVDKVTGICCEPNDPTDLANALITVLTSRDREQMGRAGYQRAQQLFSEEKMLKIFWDYIVELSLEKEVPLWISRQLGLIHNISSVA